MKYLIVLLFFITTNSFASQANEEARKLDVCRRLNPKYNKEYIIISGFYEGYKGRATSYYPETQEVGLVIPEIGSGFFNCKELREAK